VDSTDDEGAPYFYARITTSDGADLDLLEGHRPEDCEEACTRFNAAVARAAAT
jgi:hypothetical protein